MTAPAPEIIDLDVQQLEALLRRAEEGAFAQEDYSTIRTVLESYFYLTNLIDQRSTTIARLRKLLFGAQTEKTSAVLGGETPAADDASSEPESPSEQPAPQTGNDSSGTEPAADAASGTRQSSRAKGHGRNGADDYPGARRVDVPHQSLQAGDPCPQCVKGTVYANPAGVLIRFMGQSPVQATIYALQKLRCHVCGKVFTAQPPEGVGSEKYDATVVSMIGLLKYGTGLPFHRLDTLQENLQVPLPASTQWEIVCGAAPQFTPVHQELIRQAADGEVLHNDDTTVKILELMGTPGRGQALAESPEVADGSQADPVDGPVEPARTGLFTSGIVALRGGERIALFFSGRRHAGENLQEVLRRRATDLPPPIQMCDALSRNTPRALQTIVANCLAHARRQFVDVHERFPAECGYVLAAFQAVYRHDALACERGLTPEERLAFHQTQSGPVLEQLRAWLKRQFDERLVEPNSGLGAAINYLKKHWDKLTLFLRVAGAPLDNNLCERALKKAIFHRKNALFYKTQNGAAVGDLYMSLIYTCQLCGANPFEYLTELQHHAEEVATAPARWLPWNYRESLTHAAGVA